MDLKKTIPCKHCGKRCFIAKATLVQTYWHVPPRGCCEGDYWKSGEMQFICYHCDCRNRLLHDEQYDFQKHKYVSAKFDFFCEHYKYSFKEIVESYDGENSDMSRNRSWVNNFWIDSLKVKLAPSVSIDVLSH
jgi:hypothetical protein